MVGRDYRRFIIQTADEFNTIAIGVEWISGIYAPQS